MPQVEKFIIRRRCDKPMRRSKEQCNTAFNRWWRCTGECKVCICCLITLDDGTEEHVNLISKRELNERKGISGFIQGNTDAD